MPPEKPTPLTAAGKAALEAELADLRERRHDVVRRIAETRAHGDLKENAAYHQAREDQARLEGRVKEVEALLRTAVLIVPSRGGDGTVRLGSVVTVEDDTGEMVYTIVGPAEADPSGGRLSDQSPVGRALIGSSAGAEVSAETPGGQRRLRVVRVE